MLMETPAADSTTEGQLMALGAKIEDLHNFVEKRFCDQEQLMQQVISRASRLPQPLKTEAAFWQPEAQKTQRKTHDLNRLGSAGQSFVREHIAKTSAQSHQIANIRASVTVPTPKKLSKNENRERSFVKDLVSSSWFAVGITVLIGINLILLGVEVDVSASFLDVSETPAWFGILNTIIVGAFVVEIALKFIAFGCREFWMGSPSEQTQSCRDGSWNAFDFGIVFISVADVVLDAITMLSFSSTINTGQLRLIRSIRIARALRGLRVVRLFRYVTALRTLILSIVSFGIVVTQLVVDHCRYVTIDAGIDTGPPQCPTLLKKYWATVSESMLTLFMAITGGLNYDDAMRPLREVEALKLIFTEIDQEQSQEVCRSLCRDKFEGGQTAVLKARRTSGGSCSVCHAICRALSGSGQLCRSFAVAKSTGTSSKAAKLGRFQGHWKDYSGGSCSVRRAIRKARVGSGRLCRNFAVAKSRGWPCRDKFEGGDAAVFKAIRKSSGGSRRLYFAMP
eukprot:Skav214333  [mRNA]  locus=scaffold86:325566:336416:+ [translate_table: standard]